MLSGVMMLHKSWFDHGGQGLNPLLPNAHSSVLDRILFCLEDRSGKSKIYHLHITPLFFLSRVTNIKNRAWGKMAAITTFNRRAQA